MKALCKEILARVLPEVKGNSLILYGNTKIYMKNDESGIIDRRLGEWIKYKNDKAK